MVNLKKIIAAEKADIKIGPWRNGKVPKSEFPIAKKAYGLGSSYKWNVISFSSLGTECRVLVVYNQPKQKYEAALGVMGPNGSLRILCCYEYHEAEPGWHCHATHDDAETISNGFMRGPWIKRIPGAKKPHRTQKYKNFQIGDDAAAIRFALTRYKIEPKGTLL